MQYVPTGAWTLFLLLKLWLTTTIIDTQPLPVEALREETWIIDSKKRLVKVQTDHVRAELEKLMLQRCNLTPFARKAWILMLREVSERKQFYRILKSPHNISSAVSLCQPAGHVCSDCYNALDEGRHADGRCHGKRYKSVPRMCLAGRLWSKLYWRPCNHCGSRAGPSI